MSTKIRHRAVTGSVRSMQSVARQQRATPMPVGDGAVISALLAPGLIDTCSNYVEHPELIAQRIERFADFVGPERVIASTDCGFGTFAGYGKIDPAVAWKKLKVLREGADLASSRLS